jgi:hypothetical protein
MLAQAALCASVLALVGAVYRKAVALVLHCNGDGSGAEWMRA